MAKFLSQEWLDLQTKLDAELPERPGVSGRLQYKVAGGPEGDVTFHTVFENGKIAENALGDDAQPDCSMTVSYKDFAAIARGELGADTAYMQGRLKMVGDMGTILALMPLLQSAEYKANAESISAQTDY